MNTETNDQTLTMTAKETAEVLRVSEATVYEGIKNGTLPSIKLGRRVLVPRAALERMLEQAASRGAE
ncbi:helix-turn-helix domain-containing protein [Ralstonia pseudosolanacearum]|uniref:helix-turn-helix domain-containing protein n=1 Tax=Ralstonia pseudosolanacearum TaxID=1310165 RepID=UPI00201DCBCF|nr:helix-turn-helix domain-containing protein [Ralstonia pseudosolanacearum]UQY83667.1 helix-turn-helix domain-containing protein [Ralstonia pseudosolanacearum]